MSDEWTKGYATGLIEGRKQVSSAIATEGGEANKRIAKALTECDWSGMPIGNKAILRSAIDALSAAPLAGWKLVPIEPTLEMQEAASDTGCCTRPTEVYAAMIDAAPQSQVDSGDVVMVPRRLTPSMVDAYRDYWAHTQNIYGAWAAMISVATQSQGEKAVASEDAAADDALERFNAATSLNALYAEEIRNLRELLGEIAKLRRYDPNNGKREKPYPARNLTLNVPAEMFCRIDAAAIAGEKK